MAQILTPVVFQGGATMTASDLNSAYSAYVDGLGGGSADISVNTATAANTVTAGKATTSSTFKVFGNISGNRVFVPVRHTHSETFYGNGYCHYLDSGGNDSNVVGMYMPYSGSVIRTVTYHDFTSAAARYDLMVSNTTAGIITTASIGTGRVVTNHNVSFATGDNIGVYVVVITTSLFTAYESTNIWMEVRFSK